MNVGSLFTGIGGIDLGLERAGMRIVWQVECDPFCQNVLERHWPHVHRRRDVRLATAANLGPCDLIAGGFPCQDVSVAGKQAGIDGQRSGLWREMHRIVCELRPRWVLVENVPGLRTRGADRVLGDLEAAGYACWPLVVGARHVGAPHRRDRVWIVGYAMQPGRSRIGADAHEGRAVAGSGHARLADAQGERRAAEGGWREGREQGAGVADARLADAERGGCRGGQVDSLRGTFGGEAAEGPGAALADADCTGRGPERGGGLLDGERAASGDDADGRYRWPARPGAPPHQWEAPRTVEAQSALGGIAHGLSLRMARARWRQEVKALGNAVVPAVVEAIGRAILAVEAA